MAEIPETLDGPQKLVFESALNGNPEAMFMVASFYHNGENVLRSEEKAFEWCLKAAEAGNVNAMNGVSSLNITGDVSLKVKYALFGKKASLVPADR